MRIIVNASGRAIVSASGRVAESGASTPTYATQFSVTLSASSGTTGQPVTATYAPVGGDWPPTSGTATTTLTGSISGGGTLSPTAGTTTPVTATLTPSADGTGSIGATFSGMTSTGSQTYEALAAATGTVTFIAASNMPTSGTAFQPLTSGAITFTGVIAYAVLYHNGADEGTRQAFGGGETPPFTAQDPNGGSYTIRLYDASTAGSLVYESPTISIASNVNHVGGSLTFSPSNTGDWRTTASVGQNVIGSGGGDTYVNASGPMSSATVYLSKSNTIPPDQPGGSASVTGTLTNAVDATNTRCYVHNLPSSSAGTVYVWIIAVSVVDGTTTRSILSTVSPITVS